MSDQAATTPERRKAAADLTGLLESRRAFSFLRLGDGEVQWLGQVRAGQDPSRYRYGGTSFIEDVRGVTGLEARHLGRFSTAVAECDFLDRCDSIPAVAAGLPSLGILRDPGRPGNASPATSNIIFEWTFFEFGPYLARHSCIVAGAEAALWRELWPDPDYQACIGSRFDFSRPPEFQGIREDGRHYSENLDAIKEDLRAAIRRHGSDTLFLSLATGAKILCHELAREEQIRAIDFGSMLRALTYAGSSGYQATRDMHHPFFFHVPFSTHMRAVERAFPALSPVETSGKAYAQLALELHQHRLFIFNTSDGLEGGRLDLSAENLRRFRAASRAFRREYWPRWKRMPEIVAIDREFNHWLRKHGVGWQGFVFKKLVAGKGILRRLGIVK